MKAYYGLASCLIVKQEGEQAIPLLKRALEMQKAEPSMNYYQNIDWMNKLYSSLGGTYESLGKTGMARVVYGEAIQFLKEKESGGIDHFQCLIAETYLKDKEMEKAWDILIPLAERGPENYYDEAIEILVQKILPTLPDNSPKAHRIDEMLTAYFPEIFQKGEPIIHPLPGVQIIMLYQQMGNDKLNR